MVEIIRAQSGGYIIAPREKVAIEDFVNEVKRFDLFELLRNAGSATLQLFRENKSVINGSVSLEALAAIAKIALLNRPGGNRNPTTDDLRRLCNTFYKTEYIMLEIPTICGRNAEEKALLEYLLRKAYSTFPLQTNVKFELARAFYLYERLLPQVDISTKEEVIRTFENIYNVPLYDYIMLSTYLYVVATNSTMGGVAYNFLDDIKNVEKRREYSTKIKRLFSLKPERYREEYETNKKYHAGHDFYSQYNILQDYPAVEFEGKGFVIPVYQYLGRKITNKIYFDLLEVFAAKERANNPKKNPYDNAFSSYFGDLLEAYVGKQLKSLFGETLVISRPKYKGGKGVAGEGPDFVLVDDADIYCFEVKATKPTLCIQNTGKLNAYIKDITSKWAEGKGLWQILNFIDKYKSGEVELQQLREIRSVTAVLVSLEPYYYWHHEFLITELREVTYKHREFRSITCEDVKRIRIVFVTVQELEELIGDSNRESFFYDLKYYADNYVGRFIKPEITAPGFARSSLSFHDYLAHKYRSTPPMNTLLESAFDELHEGLKRYVSD